VTGLVSTVILGVISAVVVIVQAFALAHIIAVAFLGDGDLDDVRADLWVLGACVLARAAIAWGMERSALGASSRVKVELRQQALSAVVESGQGPDPRPGTAEVTQLATRGLDALDAYFARYLPQLVLAVLLPVAVLATILPVDRLAFVTIAVTLPLIPLFMALVGMATEASNRRRWAALTRLGHHFLDVVQGMTTLKLFGRGKAQIEAVGRITEAYRVETMATLRIAFLSSLVLELLATLSVALVAVGVGLRLAEGGMALQTGLLVLILAPEAYLPLRMVGTHYHASAEGLAAAEGVLDLLDRQPPSQGSIRPRKVSRIEFVGVTVDQPGRMLSAPHGLDVVADAGAVTALVGDSGTGKSTALSLVLGLASPSHGDVYVADAAGTHSVSDLDLSWWRAQVAWVPQEPTLIAGSIADNVRWGDPQADDEQVAATMARVGLVDDDLLPSGPSTLLDERSGVSSGQRRRIAVARALLRGAAVVVLDEPTAGLDAETEAVVVNAIRHEAGRGAVVLVVAHREALVDLADRVVVVTAAPVHSAASAAAAVGEEGASSSGASSSAAEALVEAMTP
jgi:thiol reductant ABC exporter CydD subunit